MTQLQQELAGQDVTDPAFPHPLVCNLIPMIDDLTENGYSREEMKLVKELQKIFNKHRVNISATCVRVPVERAHSLAITIETRNSVKANAVQDLLRETSGLTVLDDPSMDVYPMPMTATGRLDVQVGRIRQSLVFKDKGIDLFVCGDQILRGQALNAVKIAHRVLNEQQG